MLYSCVNWLASGAIKKEMYLWSHSRECRPLAARRRKRSQNKTSATKTENGVVGAR
jgi:hypothetical protein